MNTSKPQSNPAPQVMLDQESTNLSMAQIIGEITYLLTRSPAHQFLFLNELDWLVMPPVSLGQYVIFRNKDRKPLAFALWAKVSPEVDTRLSGFVGRLSPAEWQSGDQLWLIDLVAPYGKEEFFKKELKKLLSKEGQIKAVHSDETGEPSVVLL